MIPFLLSNIKTRYFVLLHKIHFHISTLNSRNANVILHFTFLMNYLITRRTLKNKRRLYFVSSPQSQGTSVLLTLSMIPLRKNVLLQRYRGKVRKQYKVTQAQITLRFKSTPLLIARPWSAFTISSKQGNIFNRVPNEIKNCWFDM